MKCCVVIQRGIITFALFEVKIIKNSQVQYDLAIISISKYTRRAFELKMGSCFSTIYNDFKNTIFSKIDQALFECTDHVIYIQSVEIGMELWNFH